MGCSILGVYSVEHNAEKEPVSNQQLDAIRRKRRRRRGRSRRTAAEQEAKKGGSPSSHPRSAPLSGKMYSHSVHITVADARHIVQVRG